MAVIYLVITSTDVIYSYGEDTSSQEYKTVAGLMGPYDSESAARQDIRRVERGGDDVTVVHLTPPGGNLWTSVH